MKKLDLKTGMLARMRNGKIYRVLLDTKDGDMLIGKTGWNPLKNYDENLQTSSSYRDLDIVKIYNADAYDLMDKSIDNDHEEKVIWSELKVKKEIKKMTLEEIEEALGYKVEVHSEKNIAATVSVPTSIFRSPNQPFPWS